MNEPNGYNYLPPLPNICNFHDVLITRMAICLAGLDKTFVDLDVNALRRVSKACTKGMSHEINPADAGWNLFFLNPDDPCPIDRVKMIGWLVDGVAALANNNNFEYESIAPDAYTNNLRKVIESIPSTVLTPGVLILMEAIEQAAAETKAAMPDLMGRISRDMRIKGMAVDDHIATGTHKSYDHYASRLLA